MKLFGLIGRENLRLIVERGGLALLNFVVLIYAARTIEVHEFGAFTTALALWFLAEIVLQSILIEPFIALSGRIKSVDHFVTAWLSISLVATVASALAFAVLAILTLTKDYGSYDALNIGLFIITFGAFHTIRRLLTRFGAPGSSFTAVTVVGIVAGAGIGAIYAGLLVPSNAAFSHSLQIAHLMGAGAGLVVSGFTCRISMRYIRALIARNWRKRSMMFSSLAFNALNPGTYGWLLGALTGPVEPARYFASRTLLRPVGVLTSALDDGGRNEVARFASRHGDNGSHAWFVARRNNAMILSAPFLIVLFIFPGFFLNLVYAGKFDGLETLVRIHCVTSFCWAALMSRRILLFNSGNELVLLKLSLWGIAVAFVVAVLESALTGRFSAETFAIANLALVLFKLLSVETFLRRNKSTRGNPNRTSFDGVPDAVARSK